jgi:hypothetical protein
MYEGGTVYKFHADCKFHSGFDHSVAEQRKVACQLVQQLESIEEPWAYQEKGLVLEELNTEEGCYYKRIGFFGFST